MSEPKILEGTGFGGGIEFLAAGHTHCGKVRDHNEDAFSISEELGFFVVSDGMGGHKAGEVVAEIVVHLLPVQIGGALTAAPGADEDRVVDIIRQSTIQLSNEVLLKMSKDENLRGTGATLVSCLIIGNVAAITHLGDSRAYLMRQGVLEQLTGDHTIAGFLVRAGTITSKDVDSHPGKDVLTRRIGMKGKPEPDVGLLDVEEGDRLLLCSDGLTKMVEDGLIGEVLWNEPDISVACRALTDLANRAGGRDNSAVLIVQVGDSKTWDPSVGRPEKVMVLESVGVSFRKTLLSDEASLF